jgi:NADH:ubiquinone oxidoreductase subunit 6 (subunit J)
LLGNPFWPFLNGIFQGTSLGITFNTFSFSKIFSLDSYLKVYLEFFGVPNGDISLLTSFNFPFLNYMLIVWIIGTLIFIFPFIKGFFERKENNEERKYFLKSMDILFLSFLFMLFIYITNTGWSSARLLMPILPFIAIIWAKGASSFKLRKAYLILAVLIGTGFIMAEGIKLTTAANEWSIYKQDFEWVKSNTGNEDLFYGNGQCLPYNIDRLVINHNSQIDFNDVNYIWVNNKWRIDFHMNEDSLNRVKNSNILEEVYSNKDTGTIIYKVG